MSGSLTVTGYLKESVALTDRYVALVKKMQSASPPLRDGDPEFKQLQAEHKEIALQLVELNDRYNRGKNK